MAYLWKVDALTQVSNPRSKQLQQALQSQIEGSKEEI